MSSEMYSTHDAEALFNSDSLLDVAVALIKDIVGSFVETLDRTRISADDFEKKERIGKGGLGEVYRAVYKKTNEYFALKILNKNRLASIRAARYVLEERNALVKLRSSGWVTDIFAAFQDENNLCIAMEYVPGGSLGDYMCNHEGVLEENEAIFYTAQIVLALEYVHSKGYIHRDVKPENLLICNDGNIKLADFGSCVADKDFRKCTEKEIAGTIAYSAPEILGIYENDEVYSFECDYWSVGVILFEMLYYERPFESDDEATLTCLIMSHETTLKFPNSTEEDKRVSQEAIDLIKNLLTHRRVRLGVNGSEEIKSHVWLKNVDWNNVRSMKPPFIPEGNETIVCSRQAKYSNESFTDDYGSRSMLTNNKCLVGNHLLFAGYYYHSTHPSLNQSDPKNYHPQTPQADPGPVPPPLTLEKSLKLSPFYNECSDPPAPDGGIPEQITGESFVRDLTDAHTPPHSLKGVLNNNDLNPSRGPCDASIPKDAFTQEVINSMSNKDNFERMLLTNWYGESNDNRNSPMHMTNDTIAQLVSAIKLVVEKNGNPIGGSRVLHSKPSPPSMDNITAGESIPDAKKVSDGCPNSLTYVVDVLLDIVKAVASKQSSIPIDTPISARCDLHSSHTTVNGPLMDKSVVNENALDNAPYTVHPVNNGSNMLKLTNLPLQKLNNVTLEVRASSPSDEVAASKLEDSPGTGENALGSSSFENVNSLDSSIMGSGIALSCSREALDAPPERVALSDANVYGRSTYDANSEAAPDVVCPPTGNNASRLKTRLRYSLVKSLGSLDVASARESQGSATCGEDYSHKKAKRTSMLGAQSGLKLYSSAIVFIKQLLANNKK